MNTTLNDISKIFSVSLSYIRDFFSSTTTNSIRIIIGYVLFLIMIITWIYYSKKTFHTINTLFRVSMDRLYYQTSLILYKNHDTIYNFKENISLLLQYKTSMIEKKDKALYYENYEQLIKEIEYIYTLTSSDSNEIHKEDIDKQYKLVKILENKLSTLQNIANICTLWIYKLLS